MCEIENAIKEAVIYLLKLEIARLQAILTENQEEIKDTIDELRFLLREVEKS